ncbi:MAG TPA: bifunctional riboflavin kinase/FAD synthetase [Sphingorhabdus sp.]|uniref:bifunctional riboflavin kinase/FAD synthetase n=1 Tax=Sphingorhabdus sp. TaxID=1902408 RepID=UPI002D1B2356|nr:bifunctional riboflavin kinase/FAD synthetase [Sphingorhabdus sp.]HMT41523.1 bifunctional riboflavin kinase/FAD synthetase [Sphingorhabdus sp.]HMU20931.1 bifunctional riboflavin kinase/FAD synthetase [Sphingorhabdus sp.]
MPRLSSRDPMPEALRGAVVALGNFDGFHLGHQAVAGEAIRQAKAAGKPAIIATFDPHPVRFFAPHVPWFRLTTLEQRQRLFAWAGADAMLVFDFDAELAATTAEDFVIKLLAERLGVSGVVTGEDFTFGKARGGNTDVLRDLGAAHGITATTVGPVTDAGGVISSSRIRDALKAGECDVATRLLTRPFAIEAIVQHGDKNGRDLGFPTANMDMGHYLRPRYGVYAVRGKLPDGRVLDGAANVGIRPQFEPPKELLEPHFFDFAEMIYDQMIEVEFHAFLRPEGKYDSLDALIAQVAKDCEDAKAALKA